ncbi:MAG: DUF1616 domain-containing protein [Haloarculaceae archaeon]
MKSRARSAVDLVVVAAWTTLAGAVAGSGVALPLLRVGLALPLVLLFPGYALLAALYPEPVPVGADAGRGEEGGSIDGIERIVLSVAVSVAAVPLVAFVLNYTSFGVRLTPLLVAVGGVTVGAAAVGLARRVSRAPDARYRVPLVTWLGAAGGRYFSTARDDLRARTPLAPRTGTRRALNVLFVVSLLLLAGTLGYAAVTPSGGHDLFSEFYLLTRTDSGQYRAENLPHTYMRGESQQLYVAVGNHEGRRVPYTVVVELDGHELDRFGGRVAAGQTRRFETAVTPDRTGDRLRLSFLLYRGQPPENPTPQNAYRETHLWVSVGGT